MVKEIYTDQLRTIVSANYAIGDLIDYQQIHRGCVNESYIIETAAQGEIQKYFLRKYKVGKKEEEIVFEHSIIKHLKQKRFDLVAGLIHTRDGITFVKQNHNHNFYAIFEFLAGDDRYDWFGPDCSKKVLENAAVVLATFHRLVFDLKPVYKRSEPKIFDLLSVIAEDITTCAEQTEKTLFATILRENLGAIISTIQRTLDAFGLGVGGCNYTSLVQSVIHCDFHPGNLKFKNDAITGLFDFDWSKVDVRCFDVALAISYFCTVWQGKASGRLHKEKAALFLHAYQKASTGGSGIGPLCEKELNYLPHMMKAANIYVMNWIIHDYYEREKEIDHRIYLRYLEHYLSMMRWLDKEGSYE